MEILEPRSLHPAQQTFLESVLRLEPQIAAFDCDGTLWSSDAGVTFFDWEIDHSVVSAAVGQAMRARYAEYKAGKVSEEEMCAEMVTMHAGISEAIMMEAASGFMAHSFPGHIFAEMHELVRRLQQQGCQVWAVSSSNEWVIRAGLRQFDIPEDRILATKAELENGIVTDQVVRVPCGPGKVLALREVAGRDADAAFGNSRWDKEMLASASHPFAINPQADLETTARLRGWRIYFPDGTQR